MAPPSLTTSYPYGVFRRSRPVEQLLGQSLRRLDQPRVGDDLPCLLDGESTEVALEQEHGVVAVPVRRGEPWRVRVGDHRLLVLGRAREREDVVVGLPGLGVVGVLARAPGECEGPAAHLERR